MKEETRKQIESLEMQKANTQQLIKENNSRLWHDNLFGISGLGIFSGDFLRFNLHGQFLLQQLDDIQSQIDQLKDET